MTQSHARPIIYYILQIFAAEVRGPTPHKRFPTSPLCYCILSIRYINRYMTPIGSNESRVRGIMDGWSFPREGWVEKVSAQHRNMWYDVFLSCIYPIWHRHILGLHWFFIWDFPFTCACTRDTSRNYGKDGHHRTRSKWRFWQDWDVVSSQKDVSWYVG